MEEGEELKGGHPPALKVGGARVVQRHAKEYEHCEPPAKQKNDEEMEDEEEEETTVVKSAPQPKLVISGAVADVKKDYPTEAVRSTHEKVVPKHQPVHVNKPAIIQQPRK